MTPRVPPEHWGEIEDLYRRFRDGMVNYATRLLDGEPHLAHDLVQETFKAAALRWDTLQLRGESGQRAWLYRVLRNKVYDRWRSTGRCALGGLDEERAADLDTPRTAVSNVLLQMCWKVIDGMPRSQRRVALLKWHGEWTNGEIGGHLGITESTVRVHLRNARRTLTAELGDEVVFPSEWEDTDPGEEAAR
ncbi:RNA polymerase sigma factor [Streptomyces sp. NPDC005017]|uniref:RNA polymerase sigma factor n=1 Tax=Streptomyces sp. NPDC005017 TaxID=3364706 RepID=UPI0036B3D9B0